MAMSCTITEDTQGPIKKIKFEWVSATDGTATGTTKGTYNGEIIELVTDPGATAPTDNYDITINDADGNDVLAGAGADRDTANTEYKLRSALGCVCNSTLTLNITNAGDSKVGTAYLYIR